MGMFGTCEISDGNDRVVAKGHDGNDDQPSTLQVNVVEDNGLQKGAVYKLTLPDGTGYRGISYTGNDGDTCYDFHYQDADRF